MVTTAAPRARDSRPEPSLSDALLEVETHDADRLRGRCSGQRRNVSFSDTPGESGSNCVYKPTQLCFFPRRGVSVQSLIDEHTPQEPRKRPNR